MSTNAQISLQWGTLPAGTCWPAAPQDFVALLSTILSGFLPGNFATFNFGPNTPAPDDQDKPWIKTTNAGYLEGLYVYAGGFWCRPHPVPSSSAQRIIWKGTEADLWTFDGGDGTNPAANPPTDTTGAFWQRDTDFGSDSTIFRFPVGIGRNPTAYDGSTKTINVGDTGGVERILIDEKNLPEYNPKLKATPGAGTWNATDATGDPVSGPGLGAGGVDTRHEVVMDAPYGSATPTTIDNLPPYIGVIFCKRTARKYITA